MKCETTTCNRSAEGAVVFDVPALGAPDTAPKANFILGLKLCRKCAEACKAEDMFIDETREAMRLAFGASGKAAPDFERAKARLIKFDDPEFVQFEAMASKRH